MEPILLYLLKMTICSGVLYAYYLLFLKDKTFHHYNRFYLLFTVLISLLLPLIKVSYFTIELNPNFYLLFSQINNQPLEETSGYDINYYSIFYSIIGLVSVFLLTKLLFGLIRIKQMRKTFPKEAFNGINFYQTNLENAPFSFFRNLFWKQSLELNSSVGKQILKHEMVHIEQKHSWDKLLMQLVKSMVWFNPLFYLINSEINLIHEYLADNKAVEKSDTKAFAQMLLGSHFSGQILPATSPFLSSNLKKRLKMLTKSKTKYSYARKLFALPILFVIVFAYLVNAKNKEILASNKAVELAVEQQKLDTIKPGQNKGDVELKTFRTEINKDNQKISKLSREIGEKSKELSSLSASGQTDSKEFKVLENDINNLSSKLDAIVNSDSYQKNLKSIDQRAKEIEAKVNSPEFKAQIALAERKAKEVEAKVNSPEFKERIALAERKAKEVEAKVNSLEFKERIALAEKKVKEAEVMINSPEFQKKIEDAKSKALTYGFSYNFQDETSNLPAKEKKQLEKKKKEFLKKKADYEKVRQELLGKPIVGTLDKKQDAFSYRYSVVPKDTNRFSFSANALSDTKIFVDGKEISKKEMDSIKPETIKRIFVEKSENGKGIIKIETK